MRIKFRAEEIPHRLLIDVQGFGDLAVAQSGPPQYRIRYDAIGPNARDINRPACDGDRCPSICPPIFGRDHFLRYYTWPVDDDGNQLRWADLPVEDKLWRPGRGDKGGFIQEVTGWKPSPTQTSVHWPSLLQWAGLLSLATHRAPERSA